MQNNFSKRQPVELKTKVFPLLLENGIKFKTINTKLNGEHDLLEFWVLDDDRGEVHCIAWDDNANALKRIFETEKPDSIEMTYKHKLNKFTQDVDYSIQKFNF